MTAAHLDGSAYGYEPPETDERFATCRCCDGSGVIGHRITVYEHGCGFPHDDVAEEPCPDCEGTGNEVFENEPVECDDLNPLIPAHVALPTKPSTIEDYNALSYEDKTRLFPHGVALDYGPYRKEGKCGFDWQEWESRWRL